VRRQPITPRRTPLSAALTQISRGNTFGDAGALRGIDTTTAQLLRREDPIAARALRLLLSPRSIRTGEEEWCLWLVAHSPEDIARSRFLSERVDRVRRQRRNDVPPWLYSQIRQPRNQYGAFPSILQANSQYLSFATYDPEIIVEGQVWKLDSENAVVTEAMLMSRVFRVWVETVSKKKSNGAMVITRDSVYNTFPCPEISRRQQTAIEDAFHDLLLARGQVAMRSIDELYARRELPRALQIEHDKLDQVIGKVFGVKQSMSDAEIAGVLLEHYRVLTADDAA
jgi:hypothetical protein